VMMDARAHGASEGPIATYGWLERNDTKAVVQELINSEIARYMDQATQAGRLVSRIASTADIKRAEDLEHVYRGQPAHIFALGESMGAGIALQSAAADPRIEGVVAEASFATLREASYDYAGLRKSPLLGKTLLAPFSWTLVYRGESLAGFPAAGVSPENAVAERAFPVLIICDEEDVALPCRHSERIYAAARGSKELWRVPKAFHTAGIGYRPEEFRRRVIG